MTPFKFYRQNLFFNLLLVYFLWGSTYLGVKVALIDFSPLLLTAIRFGVGGIILFTISIYYYGLPSKEKWMGSSKIGILLSGIGTSIVAYAIDFMPSGVVAVLVAILPLWTFILDYLFFSKLVPSKLSLTGMLAGILGILLLFNPFGNETAVSFPLVLLVMLGSISWAYGSLLSPKTSQATGIQGIAIQMMAGGLFALLFSFILEKNQFQQLSSFTLGVGLAIAYLIFIGSYVGYSAYIWLINNAPPLLTSSYAFVNPIVALVLGAVFANESLTFTTQIACAVILLGIILMILGRRRTKEDKLK